ncbi:response regulator [Opitutaceae bacterium EW11]|nr:response regulator [Opitutaceae bacterium EW11]
MKVLIVEDEPVARLYTQTALKNLGLQPIIATDGEEALALLENEPIRLVVSDWVMPKIDGLEFCRRLRAREGDYIYFILLTQMSASPEHEDEAIEAGVDDFLVKPVNPRELKVRLHVARRILEYTARIQRLESFIPICSYCKKVRDDQNYWQRIENYINERTGSEFSHSVCPDCYKREIVPQLEELKKLGKPRVERRTP